MNIVKHLTPAKKDTVKQSIEIEIASRFADGEDAYNNKRARLPEGDGSSRQHNQRRRSRNEDGRTRCNQVAAGYGRGDEEGNENRVPRQKQPQTREAEIF
jgi:hypothetical protein